MSRQLKLGDRVRVTARSRKEGYQPGDQGTVTHAPKVPLHQEPYYIVAMDKDGPTRTAVVFTEGEIELDRGSRDTEAAGGD
jgi:hypothetical protein